MHADQHNHVGVNEREGAPADENVVWHPHAVTREDREQQHGHQGVVLWFTGLSGSGKSTVAGALEQALFARGVSTYLMATTCATVYAVTWALLMLTDARIFVGLAKSLN